MSEPTKRRWVSDSWPADAAPYDHIRSLLGVTEILEEYIESRWQNGGHLGLEVIAKTIREATQALDDHFKISDGECGLGTPAEKTEDDAHG